MNTFFLTVNLTLNLTLRLSIAVGISLLIQISATAMSNPVPASENAITSFENRPFVSLGETKFSVLFWDIYKSKLLTTSGYYPIDTEEDSLLFNIHYLRDISNEDLVRSTAEQWQHIGLSPEQYERYLPELSNIWPDIKDGDSLSLLVIAGKSVFYFNEKYAGTINDKKFGQIFIDIWLSEKTSEPELRRELLKPKSSELKLSAL